ncbi:MAG TPA: PadR family transcriptional regulator [Chloroflexia bacterium]|nr:PadR family transcriptional regulator [Chloroflexia bacterium]
MPRPSESLVPAAYALLGLLAGGSAHGYDLHRPFARGGALADVCRLPLNQHYALLKQLQRRGLAAATGVETSGAAPPRRRLAITPAGQAALTTWLATPVPHTRDVRLEFLLKLYFAGRLAPAQRWPLLEAQIGLTRALITRLEREAAALSSQAPGEFHRLVVDMRLRQNRAVLAWLEATLAAPAA